MKTLTVKDLDMTIDLDTDAAARIYGGQWVDRGRKDRTAATAYHTEREAGQNFSSPGGVPTPPPKNDGPSPKDAVAESTVYIVLDIVSGSLNTA